MDSTNQELLAEIKKLYNMAYWENKPLFDSNEVLIYLGLAKEGSRANKHIIPYWEKTGALKSVGGRPKYFPAVQVKRLRARLASGDMRVPSKQDTLAKATQR